MSQGFESVAALFLSRVERTPSVLAYKFPTGRDTWGSMTWGEAGERVKHIACGLHALGLEREHRVGILSTTRLEWILADMATLCAGGATTTIYPSNTPEECAYILGDSQASFAFAEDNGQAAKLVEVRDQLPSLRQVVVFDGDAGHDGFVLTLADLEEKGRAFAEANPGKYEAIAGEVKRDDLSTLIYTSGTTGKPKGVELIHDCWLFEAEAIDQLGILSPDDHQYLWLPLSHSFGKVLEVAQLHIGFPTTVDGRIPKLVDNLAIVKPTFMAAAPRIFEKVYNKVVTGAAEKGGLTYKIFTWAVGVGRRVSALTQQGKKPGPLLGAQFKVADKLVFSKLRARFGGRVRFFISGSAPLSRDMAEFFHAAGILILEGYGLTESSAATFVNVPSNYKFGTVGPPLPGVEVKIAPEDGEVLLKARGVMRGYHNLPEATAEILEDRWLRTGDIGELDADGYLRITDRKKDLIKTSGGKYVAPQKLEAKLKALCPYLSQVLVHGNMRNFCSALVTLDEESIKGWATERGLGSKSTTELAEDPQVRELVQDAIKVLNADLASYETLKRFAILPKDLSVEDGELTPSLKVKRKVVETKYKDVLDGFYEGSLKRV